MEPLEARRLLAVVTVDTELDVVDHTDGLTSLREAIVTTNTDPGPDQIVFDFGHDGPATILLEQGELEITEALTITGDGPDLLTIDAQQQSRIFNVTAKIGDFTVAGTTLTNGRVTGDNAPWVDNTFSGGAVRSLTTGHLTVADSKVIGNSVTGESTEGGGVYAVGKTTVTSSTISGNSASGEWASGGGIGGGTFTVIESTIAGNTAHHRAGGILAANLTVASSTVSGNSASFAGGGIGNNTGSSTVTVIDSTISGNSTDGPGGGVIAAGIVTVTGSTISGNIGGGIAHDFGQLTIAHSAILENIGVGIAAYNGVTVTGSTISDNFGGGLYGGLNTTVSSSTISGNIGGGISGDTVTVRSSTISGNETESSGGGIYGGDVTVKNSIVAGNMDGGTAPDVHVRPRTGTLSAEHSLIGDNAGIDLSEAPIGSPDANGNLIGGPTGGVIDPLLGPLVDNGGPTWTLALLPGSPAIDAGDPTIQQDLNEFDQRGAPFVRVADGDLPDDIAIDIGAYEAQSPPSADFDNDSDVDGFDFLVWQRGYGTTVGAARSDGNSDDDGDVDSSDLAAWEVSFGNGSVPLAAVLLAVSDQLLAPAWQPAVAFTTQDPTLELRTELRDAAIALAIAEQQGLPNEGAVADDVFDLEIPYEPVLALGDSLPSNGVSAVGTMSTGNPDEVDEQEGGEGPEKAVDAALVSVFS